MGRRLGSSFFISWVTCDQTCYCANHALEAVSTSCFNYLSAGRDAFRSSPASTQRRARQPSAAASRRFPRETRSCWPTPCSSTGRWPLASTRPCPPSSSTVKVRGFSGYRLKSLKRSLNAAPPPPQVFTTTPTATQKTSTTPCCWWATA